MQTRWGILIFTYAALVALIAYGLFRPAPRLYVDLQIPQIYPEKTDFDNLEIKRGAVGFLGPDGKTANCRAVSSNNPQFPTASLAKVITTLVVLDAKPIDEKHPETITITDQDMADHWNNISAGGSYAPIVLNEKLTERQLLEGVMLASANNMADIVAKWAFGSMDNYHKAAAKWLKQNKLDATIIGTDASGFDPSTKSTPMDLCRIMLLAAQNPTLVSIMNQHEITLPTGDKIANTNRLLGENGVFAGKTGFTDEAGHGLMLLSKQLVNDQEITVATVNLGNDDYPQTFESSKNLLTATASSLRVYQISKDKPLGSVGSLWGDSAPIAPTKNTSVYYWADEPPRITEDIDRAILDNVAAGGVLGNLWVDHDSYVNLETTSSINPPSALWRLTHPF